ncbi:MAG: hypothetical protein KGZ83_04520 [Sulfuricella sp.]|nr:hypothetical protein [Sulfuricella sp.]
MKFDRVTEKSQFLVPEKRLPVFQPGAADIVFLNLLNATLGGAGERVAPSLTEVDQLFALTGFPQACERIILALYSPGFKRILVSRSRKAGQLKFSKVLERLLVHPRVAQLTAQPFRLQIDFVSELPVPVDFYAVGMQPTGKRHFEIGLEGLIFKGPDGKTHIFPPGDGYVRSVMSMSQLRAYLNSVHGEDYLHSSKFQRFRSESYLSGQTTWLRLYRGYPVVGALTKAKIEHAVELAIQHIQRTQERNGKYLYYYDSALDSRRDHEHPNRDPDKNPFYNILRHGGGGLTCVYYEKYSHRGDTLENIRRGIDYLMMQTRHQDYAGREGAFIYSEKKAKLGGSGIALYLLSDYQSLTGDDRYREWADKIAWHLVNQITASGEFIYYNIYLDKPVTEEENQNYFSFYYPGEAVCGLAKYLHLADQPTRETIFAKLHSALEFLIRIRPQTRADQYTAVPSDAWLMMGIMELWDFEEMRRPLYSDFVFADADKMIANLYKVPDAPYPDYAGAFYYTYGDYPYADGARCEGMLGAYQLALKMGDQARAQAIWPALRLAAWALMHLVNTEDAIYFARNPNLALGGIRFKYTRQWFRIDTIQHVASFYAKLLPFWEPAEEQNS